VMVPMADAEPSKTRARDGARGATGYREASCGTVTTYGKEGERLRTLRVARMPEAKKRTLKEMLVDEVNAILDERPGLTLVKLADGAKDNWKYLAQEFPAGHEVVDFFHAAEHLKRAMDSAHGKRKPRAGAEFERLRALVAEKKAEIAAMQADAEFQQRGAVRRPLLVDRLDAPRRLDSRRQRAQAGFRLLLIRIVDGEKARQAFAASPPCHERDIAANSRRLAHGQRDRGATGAAVVSGGHTRRSTIAALLRSRM